MMNIIVTEYRQYTISASNRLLTIYRQNAICSEYRPKAIRSIAGKEAPNPRGEAIHTGPDGQSNGTLIPASVNTPARAHGQRIRWNDRQMISTAPAGPGAELPQPLPSGSSVTRSKYCNESTPFPHRPPPTKKATRRWPSSHINNPSSRLNPLRRERHRPQPLARRCEHRIADRRPDERGAGLAHAAGLLGAGHEHGHHLR
jgi:hypothetical protein